MIKVFSFLIILLLCACRSDDSNHENVEVENKLGDFTITEFVDSPAYIQLQFSAIKEEDEVNISNRQLYIDLTFNWSYAIWQSSEDFEVASKKLSSSSHERILLSIYQTFDNDQKYHVENFESLELWAGDKHASILNDYVNRNGLPIDHLFEPGTAYEDFYNTDIKIIYTISGVSHEVVFHLADLAQFNNNNQVWTDHNPTQDNLYLSWATEAEQSELNILIFDNDLDNCNGVSIDVDIYGTQEFLVTPDLLNTYCPEAMHYRYSIFSLYNLEVETSSDVIAVGTVSESIRIEGTIGEPSLIPVE